MNCRRDDQCVIDDDIHFRQKFEEIFNVTRLKKKRKRSKFFEIEQYFVKCKFSQKF